MSALLNQRARISRVRRIQHGLAASRAAEAVGRVQMLENNVERLSRIRGELRPTSGETNGAALARMGELAMRLDQARFGLAPTVENARAVAATRETERRGARRDQESAEKLERVAATLAEAAAERRLGVGRRPQPRLTEGEQE